MVKSARMNDYFDYLEKMFIEAEKAGEESVDITAKDLHDAVSELPTLPTCCMAMKQAMREGDELIFAPGTRTGFGVKLQIRYLLKNRTKREVVHQLKKRGRKKGQKVITKTYSNTPLMVVLTRWLDMQDLTYSVKKNYIVVELATCKWHILVDSSQQGKKIQNLLYNLLCKMEDVDDRYSICYRYDARNEHLWNQLPFAFKDQYHLSLLSCTKGGKLKEIFDRRNIS